MRGLKYKGVNMTGTIPRRIAHAVRGLKLSKLEMQKVHLKGRIAHAVRGLKSYICTLMEKLWEVASLTRCVD